MTNNTINFTINVSLDVIIELKKISVKSNKLCNIEENIIIIILVKTTKTFQKKRVYGK